MKRFFVFISLCVIVLSANAQTAALLSFSPDSRSLSLGLTGVSSEADAFSNFNNGAAIMFSKKSMEFSAFYTKWQPENNDNSLVGLAGYYRINNKLAFDLSFRNLGYKSYPTYNEVGINEGDFTPSEMSLSAGVTFKSSNNLAYFADINYVKSDIGPNANATAFALDFGMMLRVDSTIRVGAKIDNLGTKLDYGSGPYSLPMNFSAGVGYDFTINSSNVVSAMVDLGYVFSFSQFTASLGVEYKIKEMIMPRLGFHLGGDKGIPSFISAGLGVNFKGVSLNCAYIIAGSDSPMKNTLSFGLGYGF